VFAICKGLFVGLEETVDDNLVDTAQQLTNDVGEDCEKGDCPRRRESFVSCKCKEDDWCHNIIFQSICTIGGKCVGL
jgi:hypothetical protein